MWLLRFSGILFSVVIVHPPSNVWCVEVWSQCEFYFSCHHSPSIQCLMCGSLTSMWILFQLSSVTLHSMPDVWKFDLNVNFISVVIIHPPFNAWCVEVWPQCEFYFSCHRSPSIQCLMCGSLISMWILFQLSSFTLHSMPDVWNFDLNVNSISVVIIHPPFNAWCVEVWSQCEFYFSCHRSPSIQCLMCGSLISLWILFQLSSFTLHSMPDVWKFDLNVNSISVVIVHPPFNAWCVEVWSQVNSVSVVIVHPPFRAWCVEGSHTKFDLKSVYFQLSSFTLQSMPDVWKNPIPSLISIFQDEQSPLDVSSDKPKHGQTHKMTSVPSEDSDQPGHQSGLIKALQCVQSVAKGSKFLYVDSEDTDQTGNFLHRSFCWFCHAVAQIFMVL